MKVNMNEFLQIQRVNLDIMSAVGFLLSVEEQSRKMLGDRVIDSLVNWCENNCVILNTKSE